MEAVLCLIGLAAKSVDPGMLMFFVAWLDVWTFQHNSRVLKWTCACFTAETVTLRGSITCGTICFLSDSCLVETGEEKLSTSVMIDVETRECTSYM